jgi:selenocysteine lyase/cysteine desulfurase
VGFAFVRGDVLEGLDPPFLDNLAASWVAKDRFEIRSDARRFESWESNPAGRLGLGRAAQYALDLGLDEIWDRNRMLAGSLRRGLAEIPGVAVRDVGSEQGAIVTFTVADREPDDVETYLHQRGINVSVSTPFSARLDMDARRIDGLVRASVHYFNTEEEVATLVREAAALGAR